MVVTDKFNITGRGVVLIVDFIKSGLCTEVWVKYLPKVDVGDTILYEGMTYTIRAIDSSRNTFNGAFILNSASGAYFFKYFKNKLGLPNIICIFVIN